MAIICRKLPHNQSHKIAKVKAGRQLDKIDVYHTPCITMNDYAPQRHITAFKELREAEVPDNAQTIPMTITTQSHALRALLWPSCRRRSS